MKDTCKLNKNYSKDVLFEAAKTAKQKKGTVVPEGFAKWENKVPILGRAGQMSNVGKKELLEDVDLFVRSVLKYVDGKRTIKEIVEKSGKSPSDVIGVIEPYRRTGTLNLKSSL
ncbi:MAG: hypothetical protein U9N35_03580 [Euryarchaeota archaeon]|nr:hypothetical protein [Euryarchaeota archaeon]